MALVPVLLLVYWVAAPLIDASAQEPLDEVTVPSVADFGQTAGEFSVSDDGRALYNVPLWVPEARGAVRPRLSLSYDSSAGNGVAGVGWSLAGLESIARCPRTIAQDGASGSVGFNTSDALCLGGDRLIPTTRPATGQQAYVTERQSFTKIVAFGMADNVPDYFTVWSKDGTILTLGGTADARLEAFRLRQNGTTLDRESTSTRVVVSWSLSKVEDRNGNAAVVTYEEVEGGAGTLWHVESRPKSITYPPNREVKFIYQGRTDVIESYQGGVHVKEPKRLTRVEMWGGPQGETSELLRKFLVSYDTNPSTTGRSLLTSAVECDFANKCKRPKTFGWSRGNYAFEQIDTTVRDAGQPDAPDRIPVDHRILVMDVNGDAKDDIVYPATDDSLGTGRQRWRVRLSTGSGFAAAVDAGFEPPSSERGKVRPVDYDRDGRMDVLVEAASGTSSRRWRLLRSDGSSFVSSGMDVEAAHGGDDSNEAYFADLDANGFPDLITAPYARPDGDTSRFIDGPWSYRLNTGSSGVNRFADPVTTAMRQPPRPGINKVIDTNGDGRAELLGLDDSANTVGWGLGPNGNPLAVTYPGSVAGSETFSSVAGDVNGDGLGDSIAPYARFRADFPLPLGVLKARLNSGNGYAPGSAAAGGYYEPQVCCPADAESINFGYDRGVRFADFNGDGATDVLVFRGYTPDGDNDQEKGLQLFVWRDGKFERAPGWKSMYAGSIAREGFPASQVLDIDGDGTLDILHREGDHLRILKRTAGPPDRIVVINSQPIDGRITIEYSTLDDPNVHTRAAGGTCTTSYPVLCLDKGGQVVFRHRIATVSDSDPNSFDEYTHTYVGARTDLHGRGWLGMQKHTVTRTATGATTVTEYNNGGRDDATKAYVEAAVPNRVTTTVPQGTSGRVYERQAANRVVVRRYANGVYRAEVDKVTETERERAADETAFDTLRRTVTDLVYDDYGNVTSQSAATTGGYTVTTESTFDNLTADWLIGLRRTEKVTSCPSGAACKFRERSFDYDTLGNPTVTVIEPNRSALKMTTTTEYGPLGIVKSIKRSTAGLPNRVETFKYEDADKLHPTATVNAAGHETKIQTHSGLGVPMQTTDPNGLVTTMKYDGFGRLRDTTRPDTSYERISHAYTGGRFETTTDGADGSRTVVVTDHLGRERQRRVRGFDGTDATTVTRYDALGRAVGVSRPEQGQPTLFTTTTYDNRDRVKRVTDPDNVVQASYTYENRKTTKTDGKGFQSYTQTTPDGDLEASFEDDPASDLEAWLRTRFEYDEFRNLKKVISPDDSVFTMQYDVRGFRTSSTNPSSGTTTSVPNGFGEVKTETDAMNRQTIYDYDELGRVKTKTSPDGTLTNVWDTAARGVGQLASATSPDGTITTYTYTAEHAKPDLVTWKVGGTDFVFDYDYDTIGRQSQIKYPAIPGANNTRLTVANLYNTRGYLSQIKNAASGGTVYWTANTRDAAGQLTKETYGNGVVNDRTYVPATGMLASVKATGPGTIGVLSDLRYVYDNNRNVAQRNDGPHLRLERFGYDSLNRLTDWHTAPAPGPGYAAFDADYDYDRMGNLTVDSFQLAGQPATAHTYTYGRDGAPKHAMSARDGVDYRYNDAGEQTGGAGRTITYNTDGLPRTIAWGQNQNTTFRYDADGARVRKQSGNADIITVGGLFERRNPDGTGGTETHNLHNITVEGRVVAQVNKVQTTGSGPVQTPDRIAYLHTDQQNSTNLTTNAAGRETDEGWLRDLFYDPFGRRLGPDHQPLENKRRGGPDQGYTGHTHDDDIGLINMKGRLYDPAARRFITPDTVVEDATSSQSHHRYTYVRNNPVTFTDPTGHWRSDSFWGPVMERAGIKGPNIQKESAVPAVQGQQRQAVTAAGTDVDSATARSAASSQTSEAKSTRPAASTGQEGASSPGASVPTSSTTERATQVAEVNKQVAAGTGTRQAPAKPTSFDVFVFGSATAGNPGPVGIEAEVIGLAGYSSEEGGYTGTIVAAGVAVGGEANAVAGFAGVESINGGEPEAITIVEGNLGVEIPFVAGVHVGVGGYATQGGDTGVFVFVGGGILGEHVSVGIGGTISDFAWDGMYQPEVDQMMGRGWNSRMQ